MHPRQRVYPLPPVIRVSHNECTAGIRFSAHFDTSRVINPPFLRGRFSIPQGLHTFTPAAEPHTHSPTDAAEIRSSPPVQSLTRFTLLLASIPSLWRQVPASGLRPHHHHRYHRGCLCRSTLACHVFTMYVQSGTLWIRTFFYHPFPFLVYLLSYI